MAQVSGRFRTRRKAPWAGACVWTGADGSDGGWGTDTGSGLLRTAAGSTSTLEPAADDGLLRPRRPGGRPATGAGPPATA